MSKYNVSGQLVSVAITYKRQDGGYGGEQYNMHVEEEEVRDWSMYTGGVGRAYNMLEEGMMMEKMSVANNEQEDEGEAMDHILEMTSMYATDRVYKQPIAVWNKVYQEFWYADSYAEVRQINESYNWAFDINKSSETREDGEWATVNRLVRAETMLVNLGVSQDKVNKAIIMANDCFMTDCRYRDFRDDLSDYLMEEAIKSSEKWLKMEEAEAKLSDLRTVLEDQINKFEALDEAIITYAKAAHLRAVKHMKKDMKKNKTTTPNWDLYNAKQTEYSQALMPKVSKKVGYMDKASYMKLMSFVGTRYWQVVLGRTVEDIQLKARFTCFEAVSELLGALFSDYWNDRNQEINHIDNWTSDFVQQEIGLLLDLDNGQAAQLNLINDLYREMDEMEQMSERERNRVLVNR